MAAVVQTKTYAGSTSPVTGTWTTAPTAGNPLVAVVNSATVVTTPAGWTARVSLVNSQGFYVYTKTAAGSSDTPSFTTSGNHQTSVSLIELNQAEVGVFDISGTDTESVGTLTTHACPTITTTGTSGDFAIAIVGLHGLAGAGTSFGTAATWNNTFTALLSSTLQSAGTGDSDAVQHFIATRSQSPAGAIGATTGTWTNGASQAFGVQLGFKAIASGTGYTASPGEPVGIADSATAARTVARTQADPVGVTDSVTPILTPGGTGYTATPSDPVGVTDAPGTVRTVVVTVTDTLGITDTGTPISFDFGDTRDDPIGISDSTGIVRAVTTAAADPVGVTDAAATARAVTNALGDPVGITDSVTPVLTGGSVDYTATPADPVGLTDSITASLTRVVTIADPLGVTDTATAELTGAGVILITDTEPITDAPTWTAGRARTTDDPVGVTDSAVAVLARVYTVTLDELVALHDAAAGVITNQDNQRDITVTGRLVNSTYRARLTPSAYTARIGDTVIIGSTIYQHVALTADHDISGDTVKLSLNGGVDWYALEHVAGTTESTWRILLGDGQALDPSSDATALVQINDDPEVVIVNAGRFYVTTA